jgi:predicted TIM-barrel fold metal-dependent hydrolase
VKVIDCDVHAVVGSVEVLEPYLEAHWREVIATTQFAGAGESPHPPHLPTSCRRDLPALDGRPAGETLASVREQALDPLGVSRALLSCDYAVDAIKNPDAAAAFARAVNDWIAAEWLSAEPRLCGRITVPSQQPELAAAEIERCCDLHHGFVAVALPVRSAVPYGNRIHLPLLRAAAERDLVVELHFGGAPGLPPTASGWPGGWMEDHVDMATAFQAQLASLVCEGVFDRFPALRVSLIESGFAWLAPFLWRFDKAWRGLRREIPWVRRPPSEYIAEHVRIALQPIDGPLDQDSLARVIGGLEPPGLLMFSTDYPHKHCEEGLDAVPAGLSGEARAALLATNAQAHYRL